MIRMNPLLLLPLLLLLTDPAQAEMAFGPGPEAAGSTLDAIVAVVNDDVITRRELDAAVAQIERQLQQKKVAIPPRPVVERQVLERLILLQLQVRTAERNGITVDDATLNAAMDTLAQRNKMTLTQLRQTVEKDGVSFAQFRDDIRRELLSARLRQKLVDSQIQVSEQDVESLQAQMAEGETAGGDRSGGGGGGGGREYHIAQILIAVPENASPTQIEAAKRQAGEVLAQLRKGVDFQQLAVSASSGRQALEGGDLGWRSADQLPTLFAEAVPKLRPGQFSDLIRSPSGFHIVKLLEVRGGSAAAASPSAPAADKNALVTQTHARHILLRTSVKLTDDEARQKLTQLRSQIGNGQDFAALARANSDDKNSAAKGGDLGWVMPGTMVPQFEQAMASLQPNQISQPFQTPFGWHIVQVLERREAPAPPEAERAKVREALLRRRADEEWEQALRRLRDEAYVEVRLAPLPASPAAAAAPKEAP
jgi:peptidyl-prolyl cis-trans isomerase SurA